MYLGILDFYLLNLAALLCVCLPVMRDTLLLSP